MDVRMRVDVSGVERELALTVDLLQLDRIDDALRAFGETWLADRVRARFDAGSWQPRAEATQSAQAAAAPRVATDALRKKLRRELGKAEGALSKFDEGKHRRRQEFLAARGKRTRTSSAAVASRAASVARRELLLAEFERLTAGGDAQKSLTGGKKGAKQVEKLKERMGRALARAQDKPLLGRIRDSFKLVVDNGRLVYASEIPWAGVHNDGGSAGNGAREPKRPFAFLEEVDLEVLVAALVGEGIGVAVR
jgi:phage gpG-like protein